jgi:hypothetical protein
LTKGRWSDHCGPDCESFKCIYLQRIKRDIVSALEADFVVINSGLHEARSVKSPRSLDEGVRELGALLEGTVASRASRVLWKTCNPVYQPPSNEGCTIVTGSDATVRWMDFHGATAAARQGWPVMDTARLLRADDLFLPRERVSVRDRKTGKTTYNVLHCVSAGSCRFSGLILLHWMLLEVAKEKYH